MTFGLMALVVVATPGPTVLLALSNGSQFGLGRAGFGIVGAAFSDAVLIAAAALGLGVILAASAFWFTVMKTIGAAYLIWLGVQMMRSLGKLDPASVDRAANWGDGADGALALFRKSLLVAVTNPKGYLFFTAFLPQFVILSGPLVPQYLTLALIFIVVDVAVMVAYACLGATAMKVLSERGALWIDRTSGGFLVALGIALTFVRRTEV
ncbi:LysE family translocator [Tropicibacter oceani]|uniref:LysE family translocator n=1 Tax=Tropicibacter oceani TaxID=3058420 RepID=A0ABY8QIH3_9RHOB|nr:LysE family translocator [Tropicibacter oceani]WGW03768.1 LysE family translocator [Tropicibacter oceani]